MKVYDREMSSTIINATYASREKIEYICPFCRCYHALDVQLDQFPKVGDMITTTDLCKTASDFKYREFIIKVGKNTSRPVMRFFRRKVKI